MVSHKFGMRSDARTFNLSGMGCSAGVISLDLAKVRGRNPADGFSLGLGGGGGFVA